MTTEEIFDQPVFLTPYTKCNLSSNNLYVTEKIYHKLRTLFIVSLQTGLISVITSEQKLSLAHFNPEKRYMYIMDLFPSDWKHIIRQDFSETPSQNLLVQ